MKNRNYNNIQEWWLKFKRHTLWKNSLFGNKTLSIKHNCIPLKWQTMCCLTLRIAQCFFYELGSREEILAEVKGRDVFCHHAVVDHLHVAVVTSPGVHVVPRPLCCVQDVCDPQPLKTTRVFSGLPARWQN